MHPLCNVWEWPLCITWWDTCMYHTHVITHFSITWYQRVTSSINDTHSSYYWYTLPTGAHRVNEMRRVCVWPWVTVCVLDAAHWNIPTGAHRVNEPCCVCVCVRPWATVSDRVWPCVCVCVTMGDRVCVRAWACVSHSPDFVGPRRVKVSSGSFGAAEDRGVVFPPPWSQGMRVREHPHGQQVGATEWLTPRTSAAANDPASKRAAGKGMTILRCDER